MRQAVLATFRRWVEQKQHGATAELLGDLERTFISDQWEGWARSHHHHTHLRFRDFATYGHHRKAVEDLLERERELDLRLAAPAPLQLRPRPAPSPPPCATGSPGANGRRPIPPAATSARSSR